MIKQILAIVSLIILLGCSSKMRQSLNESTITYQAVSRGFYLNVEIKGNKMTISEKRDATRREFVLNSANFAVISTLYKKIKLDELERYIAPSEKRLYDGAAMANLTINYQGKVFNSQSFDHGNPSAEIAEFIDKIISFTEN